MGCDIHAGIEYRPQGSKLWVPMLLRDRDGELSPSLDLNRDYDLFAILADVRNGHGFAGIQTGDGFVPMSSQRGIPEDVSREVRENALSHEHSATWVSLNEILAYDWRRTTTHYGVVNAVQFEEWDRMKRWEPQPPGWCGDITGPRIRMVFNGEMREHIQSVIGDRGNFKADLERLDQNLYTRISWVLTYAVSGRQMWDKILPHMLSLGREHGFDRVRLVMDFDS